MTVQLSRQAACQHIHAKILTGLTMVQFCGLIMRIQKHTFATPLLGRRHIRCTTYLGGWIYEVLG